MFRRWKWFRRRRRSSSAQRAAAAAALRDDRLVREALDDYVRLTFRQGAESPAGPRCSLRRLPLDSAPRGHGRWNLDEQLLGTGRRRSYTVLYLGTSPADSRSSKTSQAGAVAGTSGFSCDCSEQSRCPHAGGQLSPGDLPRRAVETADASTQAPIPRKPFRPWKQQKKQEEPDTKGEPTSSDKAVQVDRSEFSTPKSSQTDSPRKVDEVDEDAEEPTARSATPRKRPKVEQYAQEPNGHEVRSQPATPRKRSKERDDTEEQTPEAARSKTASPRKRSLEEEDTEEPNGQVVRSQTATPRKRSKEREDTEEPTRLVAKSQSATPRKGVQVEEEATGASAARWRPRQVEAVTQTDDPPSQQTVVRLLPGPSGLPTIVIESTPNLLYAYPNGQSSTSNVGVQVRDEQPVAAAGESSRSGRPGERRGKAAVAGRGRPSRTRVDGRRGGEQRAAGPLDEAPPPHADDPGSLRWAQWDDKQSPWVASHKYSILDTTEESNDSALRASGSSQNIDKRIAVSKTKKASHPLQRPVQRAWY